MKHIILFIMTYIFVFLIYQIFIVRNKRRNSKKRPMEINYLIQKYNIDISKINYKKLLKVVALISSLDISIIVTIATLFDNYLIQIIIVFVLVIPTIMISYSFVGKYYKKGGINKDE